VRTNHIRLRGRVVRVFTQHLRDPDVDDVHTTSLITIDGLTIDTGDCVFAAWRPLLVAPPRTLPSTGPGRPFALPRGVATSSYGTSQFHPSPTSNMHCAERTGMPRLVSRNRTERQIGIGVGSFPALWLIKLGTLSPAT
jgi:hypothetical protein